MAVSQKHQVVVCKDTVTPPSGSSTTTSIHSEDVEKTAKEVVKFDPAELELPAKLGHSSFTRWLYREASQSAPLNSLINPSF